MAISLDKRAKRIQLIQRQVRPATETAPSRTLYMFLWGRIKSGKTSFISTGPRPINFLAEPGHMTIRHVRSMDVFPIDEQGDYIVPRWKDAYDFLFYLRYAEHDYRTVGIDSMSGVVDLAMRFINKDEEARDDARAAGVTDQRTWGRLASTVIEWLEELETVCKTRKMHLILTAHERQPREDDEFEGFIIPDMTPSIRRAILKRPDIIARTFTEEEEGGMEESENIRFGMTFRDPDLMVGERVTPIGEEPWLPRHAYDVTVPKLVQIIDQKKGEKVGKASKTGTTKRVVRRRKAGPS